MNFKITPQERALLYSAIYGKILSTRKYMESTEFQRESKSVINESDNKNGKCDEERKIYKSEHISVSRTNKNASTNNRGGAKKNG